MKEKIKLFVCIALPLLMFSCVQDKQGNMQSENAQNKDTRTSDTTEINILLDSLNLAAAEADFNKYFSYFAENATYNGTDATENWDKASFKEWAKPYFDAKTTWNFKSLKRNIYFGEHDDIAWFDELLSTQMKICRGSGVLIKQGKKWKIKQYVLSMTIPNSNMDKIVDIKTSVEDSIMKSLQH